jgi:hypothetical protein
MEYLPIVLFATLYLLANKLRSFKVEIDFKDDDPPRRDGDDHVLSPHDEDVRLLKEGARRGRRKRRR